MEIGGRTLHFLDLSISISNGRLETSVYSKPTDAHLYLNANSCHPKSQILGIVKGVALRIRRICSMETDYKVKSNEYAKYLIECGHDEKHVWEKFKEVEAITRSEARRKRKKITINQSCFLVNIILVCQISQIFLGNIYTSLRIF